VEALRHYREVWCVDTEYHAPPGERPTPICLAARELFTGRAVQRWLWADADPQPPLPPGPDTLFVAYFASAELSVYLALDWLLPARILDLYAEFCRATSGVPTPCGRGLLGALTHHGIGHMAPATKDGLRQLAIRGGPYTDTERLDLLAYCQSDADALVPLLSAMLPALDLPRALLRGRYLAAVARMEAVGVPLDADALDALRRNWSGIKARLVAEVDRDYGVFVPLDLPEVDPQTAFGAAVLAEAADWRIDPRPLAQAARTIWEEERAIGAETVEAVRHARRLTGLTSSRINRWEEAGKDHSTWPALDEQADELAAGYPALGIADALDPAALLWARLREPDPDPLPRHAPAILRRAAELVHASTDAPVGPMRFCAERWADYLARKGIPWPYLESGALALDDDTFREMARAYPAEVGPIRELRHALGQLRLQELAVGADGRNRCLLSPFGSRTGRNQPSNSRFIFGPSTWLRSLIRPEPGKAVAYVDWEQQEFGIGAALSGDRAMMNAYQSGDPYLTFAKQAGAVPPDATKQSHKAQRDLFKLCALGVQYGMGAESLARRIGKPVVEGRELLRLHRETYPRYWRWSDAVQDFAMLRGYLETVFGWRVHVGPDANPRSLRNFPLQGNGAEMLRLACCLATERGIRVCCPVHDALLVEGPGDEIHAIVAATQAAMREASELVLPGFQLRTDAKIVRWPDRYADERGERMWETVWSIVWELGQGETTPTTSGTLPVPPVAPPPLLFSLSSS
jgi:hypothetical protein